MADDTLSPIGFETSRLVKTHMPPQERYALACLQGEHLKKDGGRVNRSGFMRTVVLAGLDALGWTEDRRIKEYAQYRLRCIERNEHNPYESE
jgi:hypothetical protein